MSGDFEENMLDSAYENFLKTLSIIEEKDSSNRIELSNDM